MMDSTEIRKKKKYGDFGILAESLGIPYEAAKKRYYRGNKKAAEIMLKIIESREKVVAQAKESNS